MVPTSWPCSLPSCLPSSHLGSEFWEQACSPKCLHSHMVFPRWKCPSLACELSMASGLWVPADVLQLPLHPHHLVVGSLWGFELTG